MADIPPPPLHDVTLVLEALIIDKKRSCKTGAIYGTKTNKTGDILFNLKA